MFERFKKVKKVEMEYTVWICSERLNISLDELFVIIGRYDLEVIGITYKQPKQHPNNYPGITLSLKGTEENCWKFQHLGTINKLYEFR